jgi:hypothetical protein
VEIVIIKSADQYNKVCLAVTPPAQKEIVYRSICGKFLPIFTRYETRESIPPPALLTALSLLQARQASSPLLAASLLTQCRSREHLILAIRVQPCHGK